MDLSNKAPLRERILLRGDFLAQFLNVTNGLAKQKDVLRLLKCCRILQGLLPQIVQTGPLYHSADTPTFYCNLSNNKRASRIVREINRVLKPYSFRQSVSSLLYLSKDEVEHPTLKIEAVPLRRVPFSKLERERGGPLIQVAKAVELLLSLAEWGELDRLRQCFTCRQWFMAGRTDQLFCGTECSKKKYRSRKRAMLREYMREYRRRPKQNPHKIKILKGEHHAKN